MTLQIKVDMVNYKCMDGCDLSQAIHFLIDKTFHAIKLLNVMTFL